MKINVVDLKGNKLEEISVKDEVFGIDVNEQILAQYVRVYTTNQRQGTASTKTRAQVSGGGKKPWSQKGTGRARHGSIRSPIWVGGGVAHGPKPKNFELQMPIKMRVLAIKCALSDKFKNKKVTVLDKVDLKKPSTKVFVEFLEKIKLDDKAVVIWSKKNEDLIKSIRNIPALTVKYAGSLSAFDLIRVESVIFVKDALTYIEKKYEHN